MEHIDNTTVFWFQIITSVFISSVVAAWYVWPLLTKRDLNSALTPLLWVHVFRYVGMTFMVTYLIDQTLPTEFRAGAAYGDLLEAALAFVAIFALRSHWRFAIPLVWVANTWGFVDLLNGLKGAIQLNVPTFNLAPIWYIYVFFAPVVVVSHVLIFWVLIKSKSWAKDVPNPERGPQHAS